MDPRDLSTFGMLEIHFLTQKELLAMDMQSERMTLTESVSIRISRNSHIQGIGEVCLPIGQEPEPSVCSRRSRPCHD